MSQTGGIGVKRYFSTGSIPVWQGSGKDIQLAQGGYMLNVTDLTPGAVLRAGTPMVYDDTTRIATAVRTGVAFSNAASNAVNYQVAKGSTLKVGDNLASGATGGKAYPITAIDTSNASYDVVTVGTTIGAVTAGDTLYNSTATGATSSALPAVNGLLYEETQVFASGIKNSVSVVIRGTVYARRIPYSPSLDGITALKNIIFSKSL